MGTGSPVGPANVTGTRVNPAATAASRVPSAPSATGTVTTRAAGANATMPAAISLARIEPLNLSDAIRNFMSVEHGDDGGGCVLRVECEFLELHHVVDLHAHRDVGDAFQDDLDEDRDAVFDEQFLGGFQGG